MDEVQNVVLDFAESKLYKLVDEIIQNLELGLNSLREIM
jgi:hypothetical protein